MTQKEVNTTTTIDSQGDSVKVTVSTDNFDINKKYLIWNWVCAGKKLVMGSQYLQQSGGVMGFENKLMGFFGKLLGASAPTTKSIKVQEVEALTLELNVDKDISLYNMLGVKFFDKYNYISLNGGAYIGINENMLRDTYLIKDSKNVIKLM